MTNEELRNEMTRFGDNYGDLANKYVDAIIDDDVDGACDIIRKLVGVVSPEAWVTLMNRIEKISDALLDYTDEDSEKYDPVYSEKMDRIIEVMDEEDEED